MRIQLRLGTYRSSMVSKVTLMSSGRRSARGYVGQSPSGMSCTTWTSTSSPVCVCHQQMVHVRVAFKVTYCTKKLQNELALTTQLQHLLGGLVIDDLHATCITCLKLVQPLPAHLL